MEKSSAKAEFQVMAQGVCQSLWLKILLKELRMEHNGPMRIYCDNKAAIGIAHNLVQHVGETSAAAVYGEKEGIVFHQYLNRVMLRFGTIKVPWIISNRVTAIPSYYHHLFT